MLYHCAMPFNISVQNQGKHFSIMLANEECFAEIFSFGGMMNQFAIKLNNSFFNVVDAYRNVDDAIEQKNTWFKSCRMSPFVCRLKNGQYHFNNKNYQLNKHYLGKHAMHGLIYDADYRIEKTISSEEGAMVELMHCYNGYDEGYPFTYNTKLIWKLERKNKLSVTSIVWHDNEFKIPYCEGWHPYFKLDDATDNCYLQLNADVLVELDDEMISTGNFVQTEDFLQATKLEGISLDNCYRGSSAILKSKTLQLEIKPNPSFPYIQVFIPGHRQNIAIENLSAPPDAFNNKIDIAMLEPHQEYMFSTSYQLLLVQ